MMDEMTPVLLVDDDQMVREALGQSLELGGYRAITAASFIEAKDHISAGFQGVIVSDIRMPGKDGFALLDHVRNLDTELPVILLTGEGDVPSAVRGMSGGAYDFLEKPCDPKHLLAVVDKAIGTRRLVMENRRLKADLDRARHEKIGFLGVSAASARLREVIGLAGRATSPVLISGARGTGRGHVARLVLGLRDAGAGLQRIDCLSPFDLAQLDAGSDARLLCDIERLAAADQLALLRWLRSNPERPIFATAGPEIEKRVQSGELNDDLFYLLGVIRIHVPPLSERLPDVPLLFERFLREEVDAGAVMSAAQSREAVLGLAAMDWPSNLKSLRNHAKRVAWGLETGKAEMGLKAQLERVERGIIENALRQFSGHASDTAAALGLPRKTFYDRIGKLGIRPEDYRES
ncbi:MAG: sigma-54-dependent Fis family transcriptional regulator [Alphaproteobacteria bacterium]|nr:sigma-54-dependent Fis family transcriptional regulator [Alphaproteobacteria bacterium]